MIATPAEIALAAAGFGFGVSAFSAWIVSRKDAAADCMPEPVAEKTARQTIEASHRARDVADRSMAVVRKPLRQAARRLPEVRAQDTPQIDAY